MNTVQNIKQYQNFQFICTIITILIPIISGLILLKINNNKGKFPLVGLTFTYCFFSLCYSVAYLKGNLPTKIDWLILFIYFVAQLVFIGNALQGIKFYNKKKIFFSAAAACVGLAVTILYCHIFVKVVIVEILAAAIMFAILFIYNKTVKPPV